MFYFINAEKTISTQSLLLPQKMHLETLKTCPNFIKIFGVYVVKNSRNFKDL